MFELLTTSSFLVLGLLTGFGHCVGMCCPFVLWIASGDADSDRRGFRRMVPHLLYNLGRTMTYTALGAAAGLLGSVVELGGSLLGAQQVTAIGVGILLVLYAGMGLVGSLPLDKLGSLKWVENRAGRLLDGSPRHPLVAGLILGFLPCGPLYGALIAAAGLGSVWTGALGLFVFGLGTAPAMLGVSLIGDLLNRHKGLLHLLSLVLILAMGGYFIWQGIRL